MDRFVVGSGRCGSTLLSRMLAESPEVLSLSEFFNGLDMTRRFAPEPATGDELAWLVSQEHPFLSMVLERGYPVPEIVYPFERPGARYRPGEGLPYLLGACLPRLADDPDTLFDELVAFARSRPPAPLREHYRALFDWLLARTGRAVWIERSGSSIDYLGSLYELFPEARFVHLHRDGPETALSMREHHAFRLAVGMTARVREQGARSLEALGEMSGREGDRIDRILAASPDVALFGRFWSGQIERGLAAARKLPPGRVLDVRFEDLLAEPAASLRRIAAFFELELVPGGDPGRGGDRDVEGKAAPAGWVERGAALVRGVPSARVPDLPADERKRLAAACAPGMRRLRRV